MRRAVIAIDTQLPRPRLLAPWVERADLVVACDGAARRLLDRGITPDLVVGDMDGVLGSVRRALPPSRFLRDPDPERTDLEKAIAVAIQRGAADVTVVGAPGPRLDHALANASLLFHPDLAGLRLRFVDDQFVTQRVSGRATVRAPVGTIVSLWTPSVAQGVTTRGLRWELSDETLPSGTRGVHNEMADPVAHVTVREGPLVLLRGQGKLQHV